jgi:DNA-binding NarL/FixJ family response regulator
LVGLDEAAPAVLSELKCLKAHHEYLRVIILSDRFDLEGVFATIASGGDCYLLKDEIRPNTLLKCLELVLMEETIVLHGVTRLIRSQISSTQQASSLGDYLGLRSEYPQTPLTEALQSKDIVRLSSRERVILWHLMQGDSNKHVARELNISEATVKTYVKALLHKLGRKNRTQAAMWAINHLGPSPLDEAQPWRRSVGLSPVSAQLGAIAPDLAADPRVGSETLPQSSQRPAHLPPAVAKPPRGRAPCLSKLA